MDPHQRQLITAANRQAWELSAPLHAQGEDWQRLLEQARQPGFSVLDACLTATLTALDIRGLSCAQVGCNNARELLSLAAFGARPALGIDQSPAFLAQGEQLATAAGLAPRLVAADIYALPAGLGQHDLVLITIGVLNWMPDLPAFFAAVQSLLAPGGRLVIYETHPFLEVFEPHADQPLVPRYSYFRREPLVSADLITYDGLDHGQGAPSYWHIHTLGAIVTACLDAGLRLQRLEEHPHSNREADYDGYIGQTAQLPMSFTLVAQRPTA
ncbi:class I SAM-dependent methyltransferase [Pseudomonas oryzihabitans]|uniref:class I SAM-dependent methyltransferase n=1 Tax=Pseudomonas oryzihabitans TaxID=47885 RepID=UPI0011A7D05E|nr:class I SAM-dependent methyltransferase [Pseudomonas oryzihabitans]